MLAKQIGTCIRMLDLPYSNLTETMSAEKLA